MDRQSRRTVQAIGVDGANGSSVETDRVDRSGDQSGRIDQSGQLGKTIEPADVGDVLNLSTPCKF